MCLALDGLHDHISNPPKHKYETITIHVHVDTPNIQVQISGLTNLLNIVQIM